MKHVRVGKLDMADRRDAKLLDVVRTQSRTRANTLIGLI